eukprot:6199202-Pleurochrysis_carterae.AAC.1
MVDCAGDPAVRPKTFELRMLRRMIAVLCRSHTHANAVRHPHAYMQDLLLVHVQAHMCMQMLIYADMLTRICTCEHALLNTCSHAHEHQKTHAWKTATKSTRKQTSMYARTCTRFKPDTQFKCGPLKYTRKTAISRARMTACPGRRFYVERPTPYVGAAFMSLCWVCLYSICIYCGANLYIDETEEMRMLLTHAPRKLPQVGTEAASWNCQLEHR